MAVLAKVQQFLDQLSELKAKLQQIGYKPNQTNTREGLANLARNYLLNYDKQLFAIDDVIYNGHYPVPIRIYLPRSDLSTLPVAVFLHGGGHMCGSVTCYDGLSRRLAAETQHIIVAVDYRLSPEFPYPTGLEDCKAVIRGLFHVLDERNIGYASRDLTLIGDSAGGALCASIAMDKEFVFVEQIKRQILLYPSLDYTGSSPSLTKFAEGYFLERSKMEWYFNNYFQNNEDRKAASPVYNEFYAKMPKTLIVVAEYDPLRDEGILYYNNGLSVSAEVELIDIKGVLHAFLLMDELCPEECAKTYQVMCEFLAS